MKETDLLKISSVDLELNREFTHSTTQEISIRTGLLGQWQVAVSSLTETKECLTLYNKFWQLQKAANLSNTQAAEYLGLNISTIKRYRNGQITPPKSVIIALEFVISKGTKK